MKIFVTNKYKNILKFKNIQYLYKKMEIVILAGGKGERISKYIKKSKTLIKIEKTNLLQKIYNICLLYNFKRQNIEVTRNAYGRQTESFEGNVSFYQNEDIYHRQFVIFSSFGRPYLSIP